MKIDRMSGKVGSVSDYGNREIDNGTTLKPALLLALTIFLIIAPAPDAHDFNEISAGFIGTAKHPAYPSLKID